VRLRPFLTRLLVLALLLQWGTAFAHCLRLAPTEAGFAVDICTPDGIHRVVLTGEGESDAPHHAAHGVPCPACLGPAAFALVAPEVAVTPPVLLAQAADPPQPPRGPPPQIPPRSCQPRAPPPTS
jgi:hypothetical protein